MRLTSLARWIWRSAWREVIPWRNVTDGHKFSEESREGRLPMGSRIASHGEDEQKTSQSLLSTGFTKYATTIPDGTSQPPQHD